MKITNPSARDYKISDRLEAGIMLTGREVKSIKTKGLQLKDAHVQIKANEAYLEGAHIPEYQKSPESYDPRRSRKLLFRKNELKLIISKKRNKLTIIPISCYNKRGWIKLLVGVGRKLKKADKKQKLIEKQLKKDIQKY